MLALICKTLFKQAENAFSQLEKNEIVFSIRCGFVSECENTKKFSLFCKNQWAQLFS